MHSSGVASFQPGSWHFWGLEGAGQKLRGRGRVVQIFLKKEKLVIEITCTTVNVQGGGCKELARINKFFSMSKYQNLLGKGTEIIIKMWFDLASEIHPKIVFRDQREGII